MVFCVYVRACPYLLVFVCVCVPQSIPRQADFFINYVMFLALTDPVWNLVLPVDLAWRAIKHRFLCISKVRAARLFAFLCCFFLLLGFRFLFCCWPCCCCWLFCCCFLIFLLLLLLLLSVPIYVLPRVLVLTALCTLSMDSLLCLLLPL